MQTRWSVALLPAVVLAVASHNAAAAAPTLERSFWLHAALAPLAQKGYWGPNYPASAAPTDSEIQNAARLLTGPPAANRLYLVYHHEISIAEALRVWTAWRQACPAAVQLVPALVLRMYDSERSAVFTPDELQTLVAFCQRTLGADQLAIYDVYARRDQGPALPYLAAHYPHGLIRLGLQPDEQLQPPFVAAVQDTWSGLCHGKTNADWQAPGFGAQTLQRWVQSRNPEHARITWDLIAVAWDYAATARGAYPGYDDAAKNQPLPAGRNRLAVDEILQTSAAGTLGGFSSDLLILQANSQDPAHDGRAESFYEMLKRGTPYHGYYAGPFGEISTIFQHLRAAPPAAPGVTPNE